MVPERIKKIVAVALACSLLCGVTAFAMMFTKTQKEENTFVPGYVDCFLKEVVENDESGGIVKKEIKVENIGSDGTTPTNVTSYVRVGFVSYWIYGTGDDKGKVAPKASVMPAIKYDSTNWIKGADGYYYYKKPLAPEEVTVNLLAEDKTIAVSGLGSDGMLQVLEVFAEAIQSSPDGAVKGSWGVSLDTDGNIVSVP